ncbi:DUF3168 domain-containing protein [Sphingobium sp. BS19]|uniref:tail completion protein gp17 n=1 Tax=Sphingobium sp. BS19 TaxID=3018973 RepID=UPI0022EEEC67|nr:DUF3168 domain-containing protein [Sphingobium sp. BS19]GLI99123.1 hypothetical protein Sbs19_29410 [Sphingobium sp. BS19]
MARDSTIAVRRAVLATMKDDTVLIGIVPAGQIYPGTAPAALLWPFVRYGAVSTTPVRAACVDGQELRVTIHGFAKPRYNGSGALVESAEDHAGRIGAAIASSIDKRRLVLGSSYEAIAHVRWRSSQLMRDGDEADAWHTVQDFVIRVMS